MNRSLFVLAVSVCLLSASCGSGANPSQQTITGTWHYSIQSPLFQTTYEGTASLQQTGNQVTGSASLSGSPCGDVIVISGTINGRTLNLQVGENGDNVNGTGTISPSYTTMSGTFSAGQLNTCVVDEAGTWSAYLVP